MSQCTVNVSKFSLRGLFSGYLHFLCHIRYFVLFCSLWAVCSCCAICAISATFWETFVEYSAIFLRMPSNTIISTSVPVSANTAAISVTQIFGPGRRDPKRHSGCSCCFFSKNAKAFLVCSGAQRNFAHTFVKIPYRSTVSDCYLNF